MLLVLVTWKDRVLIRKAFELNHLDEKMGHKMALKMVERMV